MVNLAKYAPFVDPTVLITIMIKTMILFIIVVNVGSSIDNMFGPLDESKQKIIIWGETLIQAGVVVVVTFLLRTVVEVLGDLVDPLPSKMSSLTAKAASFVAGYALFSRQKNLSAKLNNLMKI